MELIQKYDQEICLKSKCPHMNPNFRIPACFGNPDTCKINNKAGYPKEVK